MSKKLYVAATFFSVGLLAITVSSVSVFFDTKLVEYTIGSNLLVTDFLIVLGSMLGAMGGIIASAQYNLKMTACGIIWACAAGIANNIISSKMAYASVGEQFGVWFGIASSLAFAVLGSVKYIKEKQGIKDNAEQNDTYAGNPLFISLPTCIAAALMFGSYTALSMSIIPLYVRSFLQDETVQIIVNFTLSPMLCSVFMLVAQAIINGTRSI